MPISAGTLFHFTGTFDNLCGILQSNFYPRFCYERLDQLFPSRKAGLISYAVPMVCFCDIPLSQISEHVTDYGKYGLGLSKSWAAKMKLNPVLYLNPGSVVSDYVLTLIMDTAERMRKIGEADFGATMSFYELMSYLKPYKGYIWKHGKLWKEKIFYNEKEWRYVPALSGVDGVAYRLNLKDYADEEKRDEANQSLEGKAPLHFDPSDIKYILISDEAEILPLLKEIEMSKGGKYNYNDLRILSTKILTIDKVLEDM